jgi:tetratricopeptide (TPR) repeat protein
VFPGSARGEDVLSRIALANDYYAKNQYQEAAEIYQKLVDRGHKNGYLFYNLGNAYLRLGNFGPSILNYIHAKQFLPRDEALDANLRVAILKTQDQLELPSANGLGSIFFWVNNFTLDEQLIFLEIINLIFWLVLGIWMIRKTASWNLTRNFVMVFLLIATISVGVKIVLESETTIGVILAKKIEVKSARGVNSVTLFQLHEGSVVSIIDRESDWYQIKLNDGKKGWAQKDFIGT